ncbi:MAG: hypothetical protein K1W01_05320 [Muribaculaceae bacterium]
MELQVKFTLSDRLFELLEDKLPNLGRRIEKSIGKELGAQVRRESNVTITVSKGDDPQAEEDAPMAVEVTAVPETEAVAEPQPEAPKTVAEPQPAEPQPAASGVAPANPKKVAEVIREIMHRARQRFEGEDYKENAGSENYKKYHKPLSRIFIQIAVQLGYEKPSYIDTMEKAEAFRAMCDELVLDDNGNVTAPNAPF